MPSLNHHYSVLTRGKFKLTGLTDIRIGCSGRPSTSLYPHVLIQVSVSVVLSAVYTLKSPRRDRNMDILTLKSFRSVGLG